MGLFWYSRVMLHRGNFRVLTIISRPFLLRHRQSSEWQITFRVLFFQRYHSQNLDSTQNHAQRLFWHESSFDPQICPARIAVDLPISGFSLRSSCFNGFGLSALFRANQR
jgi:hypothetical protein